MIKDFIKKLFAPKKATKKYEMECFHTADEMICRWVGGKIQLILNKKNNHVYKFINGVQESYWKSLSTNALLKEQFKCEYLANKMF